MSFREFYTVPFFYGLLILLSIRLQPVLGLSTTITPISTSTTSKRSSFLDIMPTAFRAATSKPRMRRFRSSLALLSDSYLENDLVSILIINDDDNNNGLAPSTETTSKPNSKPRLCVVRPDGGVHPLCTHGDDVETDLYVDPRLVISDSVTDDDVVGRYGEGWYGQRVVPSLGGGPGYGAEASDVWSVDEELLERIRGDGDGNDDGDSVELPVLDVGIAHGEKARGGAY